MRVPLKRGGVSPHDGRIEYTIDDGKGGVIHVNVRLFSVHAFAAI